MNAKSYIFSCEFFCKKFFARFFAVAIGEARVVSTKVLGTAHMGALPDAICRRIFAIRRWIAKLPLYFHRPMLSATGFLQ